MLSRNLHLPKYDFGAHFLTASTFARRPYFTDAYCARVFCEELESARQRYGFWVLAFVVMPDHVHLLLWWEAEAAPTLTISKVAWAVKGLSARRMVKMLKESGQTPADGTDGAADGNAVHYPGHSGYPGTPAVRSLRNDGLLPPVRRPRDAPHYRNWRYKIWQQGAGYDFNIYTERKLMEKIRYIHANPLRAGLAETAEAYPWSSAANYAGLPAQHPVTVSVGLPAG